jgi:hypothetical protein
MNARSNQPDRMTSADLANSEFNIPSSRAC